MGAWPIIGQYVLPSLIQAGGAFLGGLGQGAMVSNQMKAQTKAQQDQNMLGLYNTSLQYGFQKYLNELEATKAKRLYASLISGMGGVVMAAGPGRGQMINPTPKQPTPADTLTSTRQAATALGLGGK